MPKRTTPDVDKDFDAKLKSALKNKSLADVQQLLRSKLQVRRVVAKVFDSNDLQRVSVQKQLLCKYLSFQGMYSRAEIRGCVYNKNLISTK